jgi:hypothetical protein
MDRLDDSEDPDHLIGISDTVDEPMEWRLDHYSLPPLGTKTPPKGPYSRRTATTSGPSRSALLEIPLNFSDSGLSMERKTKMVVNSSFPALGRWQAGLGASTCMRGRTGVSTGKAEVYYSLGSKASLRGGVVVGEHPNFILGGTFTNPSKTSSLTATFQTRPKWSWTHSNFIVSTKHVIDPRFTISATAQSSSCVNINVASKTTVPWNIGLGLNWRKRSPSVQLQLSPQLGNRQLHLTTTTMWSGGKDGNWAVGGTLSQRTKEVSPFEFSLGVRHTGMRDKGLVWVFSLSHGGFVLRIPIVISTVVPASSLWYPIQVTYFLLLSRIVQDAIASVLQLNCNQTSDKLAQQQKLQNREKVRQDAARQQLFMERQAKIQTEAEEKRNGLVVQKAVYHAHGGDSWDVTIPLQFWVSDSCLQLSASSKCYMLGFYDVAASASTKKKYYVRRVKQTGSRFCWLWAPFVSIKDQEKMTKPVSAKLSVNYAIGDDSYEITIQDDEELTLPSPKAKLVNRTTPTTLQ